LALDYNSDGSLFASGGKDCTVRIYDEVSLEPVIIFEPGMYSKSGHANRIFSVKFLPKNTNILLSSGWDCNVLIWDIR